MKLEQIFKKQTLNSLEKKNINTIESLKRNIPKKYYDFRSPIVLSPMYADKYVSYIGTLTSITSKEKNGRIILSLKVENPDSKRLNITYMGNYYMKKVLEPSVNHEVICCGKLEYNEEFGSYSMLNPIQVSPYIDKEKRIVNVYAKIKGISEEGYQTAVDLAFTFGEEKEYVPEPVLKKYGLPDINNALKMIHYPKNLEETETGRKRLVFDDLLYYALKLGKAARACSTGSPYNIKTMKTALSVIDGLPFTLTNAQNNVLHELMDDMKAGRRVNALLQGDVGCGKTIVALLLMTAMADSGYQSVLMAPTVILATQHYNDLRRLVEPYGYNVAFLAGKIATSEKKKLLAGIKNGEYQFVVGTHSVIGKSVEYQNLALAITDEEHKFGVLQRDEISKKAMTGTHTVIMSATPIPRTLAYTMYGGNIKVCTINELPSNRKPLQTAIAQKDITVFHFIESQLALGRQAYVVCPLIEKADENSVIANVASLEEVYEDYSEYFKGKPVKIATVNGKMEHEKADEVISAFARNEYQILISTTVIEVGVNVPNASVIVISNAERFGLSALHQLRGRVGRGGYQSYCILKSTEKDNDRLNVLCNTNDGFKIAEEDLRLRKSGDLIGTKQSGKDYYAELMLQYPNMFQVIRELSEKMLDRGEDEYVIKAKEAMSESIAD